MSGIVKAFWIMALAVALGACTRADPETDPVVDLGDFRLGHNVAVTQNARKIGPSRTASPEEMETALESAMEARFRKYQGEKLYHVGINVDGYALAIPGIPVVLSPKSVMAISVNVWDDSENRKLTKTPRRMAIFEQLDGGTIVGSGITQTREEQLDNLARQMARAVERYLVANSNWFGVVPPEEAVEAAEKDELKLPEGAPVPPGGAAPDLPETQPAPAG